MTEAEKKALELYPIKDVGADYPVDANEVLRKAFLKGVEYAKQSKQEEVDHVKDFHTWRLPNEKPQEKVDKAMTKEIFDLATKIRKGKWTRAEIASEVELLFRRNTLQDNGLRKAAEKAFNQARKQTSMLGEKDVQMTDYLISPKYKTFEDYWNSKKH